MRKILFLALMLSILAITLYAAEVTIGTGNDGETNSPVTPTFDYSVSQVIYLKSELGDLANGGIITHIAFQTNGTMNNFVSFNLWAIHMKEIDISTETFTLGQWIDPTTMTEVLDGDINPTNTPTGYFLAIALTTPFYYSGVGNLAMSFREYQIPGGEYPGGHRFRGTDTPEGQPRVMYSVVQNGGQPYLPTNQNGEWTASNMTATRRRPNTRITFEQPTAGFDLAITGFVAPSQLPANSDMLITVMNRGLSAVGANGYTLTIQEDEVTPVLFTISTTNALPVPVAQQTHIIPANTYNNWQFTSHATTIALKATVNIASDGNGANNSISLPVFIPAVYDLSIDTFNAHNTPAYAFDGLELTVKNNGFTAIGANSYEINIYNGTENTPRATIAGVDGIAVMGSESFTLSVSEVDVAGLVGTIHLRAVVSSLTTADGDPSNNEKTSTIHLFPSVIAVGTDGTTKASNMPYNLSFYDSVVQTLYTSTEFGGQLGKITHIGYRVYIPTNAYVGDTFPVNVYLANTTKTAFASDTNWVPMSDFTLVAEDYDLPILEIGDYEVWIELDEPFSYTGGNLAIMSYKDHNSDHNTGGNDGFYRSNAYPGGSSAYVTMYKRRDTTGNPYDPENLTAEPAYERTNYKPQTKFYLTADGYGRVHGVVTNTFGTALSGVSVRVEGTSNITQTNPSGEYSIYVDVTSTSNLVFSRNTNVTQTVPINSLAWDNEAVGLQELEYNVQLAIATPMSVTGTVRYGDTGEPIAGVEVRINNAPMLTDNLGVYTFSGLWTNTPYPVAVTINTPGYLSYSNNINVSPDELVNGVYTLDITILEVTQKPLWVQAYPNPATSQVEVKWFDPTATPPTTTEFTLLDDTGSEIYYGTNAFIAAHRYTATMLEDLEVVDKPLVKVSFRPQGVSSDFAVLIWTGANLATPDVNNPTYMQNVTQVLVAGTLNEIILDVPVMINYGDELVIGIRSNSIRILMIYDGLKDGYGNKYYVNGAWTTVFAQTLYADANWLINGFVLDDSRDTIYGVGSTVVADGINAVPTVDNPHTRAFASKYSVYRMTGNQTIAEAVEITHATYNSTLTYLDNIYAPGVYRYAVRSIYSGVGYGQVDDGHLDAFTSSAPSYSNPVSMASSVSLTVNVSTIDDADVAGAVVSVAHGNHAPVVLGAGQTSAVFTVSPNRTYRISVALPGYVVYHGERSITDDTSVDVELKERISQVAWSFAEGLPVDWVNTEATEDGRMWQFGMDSDRSFAFSESRHQTTGANLNPDNWLISSPITFPMDSQEIYLTYRAAAGDMARSQERLIVYNASYIDGDTPAWTDFIYSPSATNPVDGWDYENPSFNVRHPKVYVFEPGDTQWHTIQEDISHLIGQTVYFAFRHAHSADQDILKLADIHITWVPAQYEVTGEVKYNTVSPIAVDEATVIFTSLDLEGVSPVSVDVEDGEYETILYAGNYTVRVTGSSDGQAFDYTVPEPFELTYHNDRFLNVTVPAKVSVGGTVEYADGSAFAGATVSLTNALGTEYSPEPCLSEDGTFTISAMQGSYMVTATASGDNGNFAYTATEPQNITADIADMVITMSPLVYTFTGKVVYGEEDTSLTGASVVFTNTAGGEPLTATSSIAEGHEGEFSITVDSGNYNVSITGAFGGVGYAYSETIVVVADVLDYPNVVVLPVSYAISGVVRYGSSEPYVLVEGAVLSFTDTVNDEAPVQTATAGENGVYNLQILSGLYTVSITGDVVVDEENVHLDYSFTDIFTINAVNATLNFTIPGSSSDNDLLSVPTITTLKTNYPNPFNPSTTIAFDMALAGQVSIEIYNIKGQRVKEVVSGSFSVGSHKVVWNGDDSAGRSVGSGVYFYRMTTSGYSSVRKMLLLK